MVRLSGKAEDVQRVRRGREEEVERRRRVEKSDALRMLGGWLVGGGVCVVRGCYGSYMRF